MARPLSADLRERMIAAHEAGASCRAVAMRYAVSVSCVIKLVQRWRRTGSLAPGQMGGWKEHTLSAHEGTVRALVAAYPDLTLEELRQALAQQGIQVGRSSIDRFLKARRLTLKKSRSAPPSRAGRTSPRRVRLGVSVSRK